MFGVSQRSLRLSWVVTIWLTRVTLRGKDANKILVSVTLPSGSAPASRGARVKEEKTPCTPE